MASRTQLESLDSTHFEKGPARIVKERLFSSFYFLVLEQSVYGFWRKGFVSGHGLFSFCFCFIWSFFGFCILARMHTVSLNHTSLKCSSYLNKCARLVGSFASSSALSLGLTAVTHPRGTAKSSAITRFG